MINANARYSHLGGIDMKVNSFRLVALITTLLVLSFSLTGCGSANTSEIAPDQQATSENSIKIIATLFPQYDFAKVLTKDVDGVNIRLLMPPGAEAHNYEPTPKDIADIQNADVFMYTSFAMEPWVEKMLTQIGPNTLVINVTKDVQYLTGEELGLDIHEEADSAASGDSHEHNPLSVDPHVWLDPSNAAIMAENVAKGLVQKLPEKSDTINDALKNYQSELSQLDQDIQTSLDKYPDRSIIFAGHYAFGYFSKKYNVPYHSPYDGFAPDAEPAPQKIAEMVDLMRSEKQTTVFYEELIDPKIARIIANETGAKLVMLHAAHNVSKDDLKNQITYLQIMQENLLKLEEGLKRNE